MSKKTFYISTAIDYVNAQPHLGHAYEKVCADAIARWHRLNNEDVFFVTGTDENAQKNVTAAKEKGMPVSAFVDLNVKKFQDLCKLYNISNDYFVRTTEERHHKVAQEIFKKMFDKGDIYKSYYEGLYCEGCEAYITEKELFEGKCPEHKKEPKKIKEECYFFKASKYEQKVLKLISSENFIIPLSKRKEMVSRLKEEGLKDLCVSRSNVEWGVSVPFDESHKVYVWLEALENYISCLDYPKGNLYKKYWKDNKNKYHLIGKGINFFHSIVWPAVLMSAEIPLPKTIIVHGYVNIGGEKMSKSLGNVVDPITLPQKYPIDSLRYYLMRHIPFGEDGDFTYETLIERHNSELVNGLGNLHARTLSMIEKYYNGKIIKSSKNDLPKKFNYNKFEESMDNFELHNALSEILHFVNECNKYINDNVPWELAKKNKKRLDIVMYNLVDSLRIISILIEPFMPETSEKIQKSLGMKKKEDYSKAKFGLLGNNKIEKIGYLFTRIDEVEKMKETLIEKPVAIKPIIQFEDFEKLDLRIGKIIKAEPHPNADKLYILQVDFGDHKRQIVAGIKQHYKIEELINKKITVIVNLQPTILRGVESQGMLLAAVDKDKVILITPEKDIHQGSRVS